MNTVDPVFAAVTAPGTPFALVEQDGLLQFAHAAPDLAIMIEHARRHGDKTFLVDFSSDGAERRLTFEQVFVWRDQLAAMLDIRRGEQGGDLHAQPRRMDRRLHGGDQGRRHWRRYSTAADLLPNWSAMIAEVTPGSGAGR
jgi:hypothetical protein